MARRSGSSSDDAWCSDGEGDDGDAAALAREAAHRDAVFHSMGYREGIDEGKAAALQAGFDAGFAAGASAGFTWGQARGAAEALRAVAAQHPAALAAHARELAGLGEEALRISPAALPLVWPDLQRCLLESGAEETAAAQPPSGAHAPQPPPASDAHGAQGHACGSGSCCGEPAAPPAAAAQPGCGAADCCGGGDCGSAPAPAATDRAATARAEAEAVRAALRGAGARLRRLGVALDSWEALSAKPRSEAAARGALAALRVAPAEEGEDWGW